MSSPQIIIVHGPDDASAAVQLLPDRTIAPWFNPGEGHTTAKDWGGIKGQRLVMWSNAGDKFLAAMQRAAAVAHEAGAESIKFITPGALKPDGWGPRTMLEEGWDRADVVEWLGQHAAVWEAHAATGGDPGPQPDLRTEAEVTGRLDQHEPHQPAPHATGGWDPNAPVVDKWAMLGLETTKTGAVANENNAIRVLENHPDLKSIVWYDEFLGRIMTTGPTGDREWADADDVRLTVQMQREIGMSRIKVSHVRAAVIGWAMAHVRNCAREWISGHKWDGIERIHAFFPDSFGAADTAYTRAVGRNFWISLVARAFQPGCKVDTMVILEGGQGAGKSSVLKAIAGEWFTVQHESITGKGFFEVLQGKMLVEIAEMDAFGKAEVTRVKQVVSTETDRYRESYGRYAKDHPRHSIFVGTTNKDDWNRDETGARRFWPIKCEGKVDIAAVRQNRAQMFAEALVAVRAGATWWEMPEAETAAEQDARREEDPWTNSVRDWLANIYRRDVTADDVLKDALGLRKVEMGKAQQMRVGAILRGIGWTKHHTVNGNVWRRPDK